MVASAVEPESALLLQHELLAMHTDPVHVLALLMFKVCVQYM